MEKDIFLSYGHDECESDVLKIKEYLELDGFSVYVDKSELKEGIDWEHQLELAIEKTSKVLFFITPHSARRPDGYCLNELALANSLNKEIIPIILKQERPPLSVIRLQFLDIQDVCHKEEKEKILEQKAKKIIEILKDYKKLDVEGKYFELQKKLSPIDFKSDFAKHKNFVGREWIFDIIDNWLNSNKEANLLWIHAKPGFGKSAIAAYLANKHHDIIGVYFCSYNSENKNNPLNFIKTLSYSFMTQIDGYYHLIKDISIDNKDIETLFEELILNPLRELKRVSRNFVFILDGLDEALKDEQNGKKFERFINSSKFKEELPNFAKIIITSRDEPEIRQILDGYPKKELKVDEQNNINDCKLFIKANLTKLKAKDINKEEFINTLLEKSEANMLYIKQLFYMIEINTLDIKDYKNFPNTLNGIYQNYFDRVVNDLDEYDDKIAPILELIAIYEAPIPKQLLQDILQFSPKKLKRVLDKLGSLIDIDNEQKVSFYHASLKDWLLLESNRYFIDIQEGKTRLDDFLDSLNSTNYKDEYLEFDYLNLKLIDYIYYKYGNLDKFFLSLENIDKKKTLRLLGVMTWYNNKFEKIEKAIILIKKSIEIIKSVYTNNPDNWAKYYAGSLINLAISLSSINDTEEALKLEKEALNIIKTYYEKDKEDWAKEYIITLNNVASSLSSNNRIKEAIKIEEEALKIVRELYKNDNCYWVELYKMLIDNLIIFYKSKGKLFKIVKLKKEYFKIKLKIDTFNVRCSYCGIELKRGVFDYCSPKCRYCGYELKQNQ